jgi:hypothetical protein
MLESHRELGELAQAGGSRCTLEGVGLVADALAVAAAGQLSKQRQALHGLGQKHVDGGPHAVDVDVLDRR